MKKALFVLLILGLFSGLVSCNNDADDRIETTGALSITIALTPNTSLQGISPAIAQPATSWGKSIKNMMFILVDKNNIIKYADSIQTTKATGINAETRILNAIPAGVYTAYIIANSRDSTIRTPGYSMGWTSQNLTNSNLSSLILEIAKSNLYKPTQGEVNYIPYQSPVDIFMASQMNVTITANRTTFFSTPFILKRIVSLLRVRINQSPNGNNSINFTDPNADLRLKNISTSYSLVTGFNTFSVSHEMIYKKETKLFKTKEPLNGYTAGKILDSSKKITLWSDLTLFPGGSSNEVAKQFILIISGMAPVGYYPAGVNVPLIKPTLLYWSTPILQTVGPNEILDVICNLTNKGSLTVNGTTGTNNLSITTSLINWSSQTESTIPM